MKKDVIKEKHDISDFGHFKILLNMSNLYLQKNLRNF